MQYIVWDVQMIMGRGKNELSEEDALLGAILLYTDIVYLFMEMVDLIDQFSK